MTDEPDKVSRTMTKLEWGVLFSIVVSAASMVFSAGVIWTTVQVHEREITMLKQKDGATTDRLARIETKLDIIIVDRMSNSARYDGVQ